MKERAKVNVSRFEAPGTAAAFQMEVSWSGADIFSCCAVVLNSIGEEMARQKGHDYCEMDVIYHLALLYEEMIKQMKQAQKVQIEKSTKDFIDKILKEGMKDDE